MAAILSHGDWCLAENKEALQELVGKRTLIVTTFMGLHTVIDELMLLAEKFSHFWIVAEHGAVVAECYDKEFYILEATGFDAQIQRALLQINDDTPFDRSVALVDGHMTTKVGERMQRVSQFTFVCKSFEQATGIIMVLPDGVYWNLEPRRNAVIVSCATVQATVDKLIQHRFGGCEQLKIALDKKTNRFVA
jgi:hypothetical protein